MLGRGHGVGGHVSVQRAHLQPSSPSPSYSASSPHVPHRGTPRTPARHHRLFGVASCTPLPAHRKALSKGIIVLQLFHWEGVSPPLCVWLQSPAFFNLLEIACKGGGGRARLELLQHTVQPVQLHAITIAFTSSTHQHHPIAGALFSSVVCFHRLTVLFRGHSLPFR